MASGFPLTTTDLALFKKLVEEQGLLFLGITSLEVSADFEKFIRWLEKKHQAEMAYLENHQEVRQAPQLLLEGARSAIVIGLDYDLSDSQSFFSPRIAQYARFSDYHKVLPIKLEKIIDDFRRKTGVEAEFRVLSDKEPLLERSLARKTQSGFIGKNTCFIHHERGSFLLLAEILTTLDFLHDDTGEISGSCGHCNLCQVRCPTGALDEAYSMDARLCLSYWTIENRGPIPERFWPFMAEYYFGCDLCQLVCPFNIKRSEAVKRPRDFVERKFPSLFETATMDQERYETYFSGTPLTRAKRNGLRRNALIAMTVTEDPRLSEALTSAKKDSAYPVGDTILQIEKWISQRTQGFFSALGTKKFNVFVKDNFP